MISSTAMHADRAINKKTAGYFQQRHNNELTMQCSDRENTTKSTASLSDLKQATSARNFN
jgi:hypothetical protein